MVTIATFSNSQNVLKKSIFYKSRRHDDAIDILNRAVMKETF